MLYLEVKTFFLCIASISISYILYFFVLDIIGIIVIILSSKAKKIVAIIGFYAINYPD